MRSLAFSLGLAAASMVAATLLAQETQPKAAVRRDASSMESAEVQAIRATAVAFEQAFDAGDAQALAALWTPQGDYVDENGMLSQGREAIEKKYASLFQQRPGMKMKIDVASIRLLGPNVAMEDGSAALISEEGHAISASRYAAVHTKDQGKWLLSAVRDMPVEASSNEALKATRTFRRRLGRPPRRSDGAYALPMDRRGPLSGTHLYRQEERRGRRLGYADHRLGSSRPSDPFLDV